MRAAALIVLGILIGFGASAWDKPEQVCVFPAYLAPSPPPPSERGYAVSDATEIPAGYYERILKER
jgi:hypothetical protein